jgi:hypothetical protein
MLAAAAITLAGCADPLPTLQTGPDPADATTPVAAPVYVPVTAGTADYRPVEPKPWLDMNERVAPRKR